MYNYLYFCQSTYNEYIERIYIYVKRIVNIVFFNYPIVRSIED